VTPIARTTGAGRRWSRRATGTLAGVATAALMTVVAFASGYGQGNFDEHGPAANQIGVVGHPNGPTGYTPSSKHIAAINGSASVGYTFTIQRYTGKNHVPYTKAINLTLTVRAQHITNISGTTDTAANIAAGDPTRGDTAGSGNNAPFSEAYLLAHFKHLTEVHATGTVSPSTVHVALAALPANATNQQAAAETQVVTITVTLKQCGYFELDAGMPDANNPHQANGFAVLAVGDVRVTGCGSSVSPGPPGGGVLGISTPGTGGAAG
jgi:hypothetical protein